MGADALSRWADWDDRNSCILFGDGAGAIVLTATEEKEGVYKHGDGDGDGGDEDGEGNKKVLGGPPGILGSSAHSNGKGYKDLNCRYV